MERSKPKPVFKKFQGWNLPSSTITSYGNLPEIMKEYVEFINGYLGVKIQYISNGPGREQLIEVR
jgi:adenylosuccinate synthase